MIRELVHVEDSGRLLVMFDDRKQTVVLVCYECGLIWGPTGGTPIFRPSDEWIPLLGTEISEVSKE